MTYSLATALVLMFVTATLAVYYWRRSAGLYSLLVEGANRFEEMRQRNATLEQAMEKAEERFKQHRESQARLERAVAEARDKTVELTRRVETKEHETRLVSEKLELQKGHLEKQLAKAEAQIARFDQTRQELEIELMQARQAAEAAEAELTLKERDWRSRQAEADREKVALEKRNKAGDPVEMKRLKRKIAQYDRLYASMKGLREMTEERNRNWEVALRKLSGWIIKENGVPTTDVETRDIGPLVGQALSAIGAQLIDDNEIPSSPIGASFAESMDADDLIGPEDNVEEIS